MNRKVIAFGIGTGSCQIELTCLVCYFGFADCQFDMRCMILHDKTQISTHSIVRDLKYATILQAVCMVHKGHSVPQHLANSVKLEFNSNLVCVRWELTLLSLVKIAPLRLRPVVFVAGYGTSLRN